jgi:hypothetical protein
MRRIVWTLVLVLAVGGGAYTLGFSRGIEEGVQTAVGFYADRGLCLEEPRSTD